ncbi:MAG: IS1595 family transposase [Rhodospirillales bacterium]|nr:IS1595 family transposase [Rhodospirillales bacterium]
MSKSALSAPHFHNEDAAFAYVETHLWPHGPVCFHCKGTERVGKMAGKTTRAGLYKCYACRKPFTVRMGTVFESSHVPLRVWLQIIYLMCSSKKGISTRQIHRIIGGSLKTAWFLGHRIREAMSAGSLPAMGGNGGGIEMDETYFGPRNEILKRTKRGKASHSSQRSVVALVERGGNSRMFHVERADKKTVLGLLAKHAKQDSKLYTDESALYWQATGFVKDHSVVRHADGIYVRGEAHTNTVEGVFGIFKRGMRGIYQHCGEQHLHRYLIEFDFRYNNRERLGADDIIRSEKALLGVIGKRLTYRTSRGQSTA